MDVRIRHCLILADMYNLGIFIQDWVEDPVGIRGTSLYKCEQDCTASWSMCKYELVEDEARSAEADTCSYWNMDHRAYNLGITVQAETESPQGTKAKDCTVVNKVVLLPVSTAKYRGP